MPQILSNSIARLFAVIAERCWLQHIGAGGFLHLYTVDLSSDPFLFPPIFLVEQSAL